MNSGSMETKNQETEKTMATVWALWNTQIKWRMSISELEHRGILLIAAARYVKICRGNKIS